MATLAKHEVTELLLAWRQGDEASLKKLMPLVFQELHPGFMNDGQKRVVSHMAAIVNVGYTYGYVGMKKKYGRKFNLQPGHVDFLL